LAREVTTAHAPLRRRHIQQLINRPYKFGFKTLIESETFPKGLDEDVVSAKDLLDRVGKLRVDKREWL